ncbi:MAG TPA: TspO/MBR family protein [Caulobacteraceae bacterium]|nr:TspO/MBR family protein [Caulobacteraceae bacterium]
MADGSRGRGAGVQGLLSLGDRTASHLVLGVALTAGAVLASRLLAARRGHALDAEAGESGPAPRRAPAVLGVLWPPLFMALTVSGLRVWNAPPGRSRTRALTLWSLIQGFSALWMSVGPRRLGGQLAVGVATLGAAAAYALQARRIDAPAVNLAAPYLGWIGFANVATEELWRRDPGSTVH